MAAYELLLLNTTIPQIQAAQSGDTYVVPRDIAFSAAALLANGTNSAPSLAFSSDTDTGIFRPTTNQLGFATAGVQAMTLHASGGLSVGNTTDPGVGNIGLTNGGKLQYSATAYITPEDNISGARVVTPGIFVIATGGTTERARITSGGYFKASNDGTYLDATGTYHELRQSANVDTVFITNTNASPTNMSVITSRYTGASPNNTTTYFLYCSDGGPTVRANIRSNGGLANYQSNNVDLSDIRTKTDISPVASYWSKIAALEIVSYKYKDQTHDDLNIGVIAQQVEQVAPEFVDADGFGETPEDGVPLKTIYNKDLTFAAIKALQEAMARIETLEAEVAALKGA